MEKLYVCSNQNCKKTFIDDFSIKYAGTIPSFSGTKRYQVEITQPKPNHFDGYDSITLYFCSQECLNDELN